MFDLRYHVASLAAVFVALVHRDLRRRRALREGVRQRRASARTSRRRSTTLRSERDSARRAGRRAPTVRERRARRRSRGRRTRASSTAMLDGKNVGVVFVGSVDQGARRRGPADGRRRGRASRARSARCACRSTRGASTRRCAPTRTRAGSRAPTAASASAATLARELVAGGPNPVLDAPLARCSSRSSRASSTRAARRRRGRAPGPPQQGETQDFLAGLYGGLALGARADRRRRAKQRREPSAIPVVPAARPRDRRRRSTTQPARSRSSSCSAGARPGKLRDGARTPSTGVLPDPPPAPRDRVSEPS